MRAGLLEQLEPPFLDLHAAEWVTPTSFKMRADARRFENWECYYAGKLGLAVAIEQYLALGPAALQARIYGLADALRARLAALPGVVVRDLGAERCGIVTFTKAGIEPLAMRDALRAQAINTSVSGIGSARLDFAARKIDAVLRASVHYYNSEDEIERFCAAVEKLG